MVMLVYQRVTIDISPTKTIVIGFICTNQSRFRTGAPAFFFTPVTNHLRSDHPPRRCIHYTLVDGLGTGGTYATNFLGKYVRPLDWETYLDVHFRHWKWFRKAI